MNLKPFIFFLLCLWAPFFQAIVGRSYPKQVKITRYYLESLRRTRVDRALGFEEAKARIVMKDGWLEADGNDSAAQQNIEAITFIQRGDMPRAKALLLEISKKSPQFFPGRFNLGKVYLYFKDHHHARIEFIRARNLVPQYWMNYYYLGRAYELEGDHNMTLYNYRIAYLRNPFDFISLIAMGDLLIEKKRLTEAKTVFRFCLDLDDGYNNALIGMGKVAYHYKEFYDATIWFRAVDIDRPYKKELHYYYAESAFFSRFYKKAVEQYKMILNFPQDAIYSRISLTRMRARLRQSQRLALEKDSEISSDYKAEDK